MGFATRFLLFDTVCGFIYGYIILCLYLSRRVKVPPRYVYISRAVDACGVFPGAKVVRGVDWRWDDQDG